MNALIFLFELVALFCVSDSRVGGGALTKGGCELNLSLQRPIQGAVHGVNARASAHRFSLTASDATDAIANVNAR